ncbi:MAG: cell cycle control cwf18 [Lasallia pustulata]|uniref:Cell cycle control cwf18 n=1 Tax=Lasallia pustulata TaxID=136370 RepID=A0A1W5CTC2_9LECA|nr:MAG: cell cycle control cwf18 [Lasallia pustulata]SLM34098.1 mRNA splicing factor, Cwf18 [Lasallia pustulata]
MASTHTSLDAAATERKARLAKLKSLKRKQPSSYSSTDPSAEPPSSEDAPSATTAFLSGRNYDPSTRGPKLGFEAAPSADQETLEDRAAQIAETTTRQAEQEEKDEKPIDLFKLQPKKLNWDLKRDVARKMERLNVQTDNAIARLVRDRIAGAKKKALETDGRGKEEGTGEEMGLAGEELVEGVHVREREEAEEERREKEDEEMI